MVGCGTTCVTAVSEPIIVSQESAEEFIERVQRLWDATWRDAYGHLEQRKSEIFIYFAV